MKKILYVVTCLGMGGAERQVVDLADCFSKKGNEVKIAYLIEPSLVVPSSENIEIVLLCRSRSMFGLVRGLFSFIALVRRFRPDVVHSHMYHANIFVRVSRFFIHFPKLICTAHSNNEGGVGRMLIYRATDFLGDVFSNVSNIAVESFERKKAAPKKSMITVYNGIDTERFKFNPLAREKVRSCLGLNNKKVFIAVGRLSVEKDYPNLILSFKCLTEKFPDARLVIVGTGVEENNIRNLIRIESLENRVQMLGLRKDISELLSAADIFVLSSSFEGFGLVVAEAMATNCYVVATDCGGVKEIVGNHGVLVKPGSVDEMSSALIMAYNKDWERIENDQCRDRIRRKFSLNSVVEQWDEIYAKSY